jgi:hypothetical protein
VPPPDAATIKNGLVSIDGPFPGADVRFTFDGTNPTETSPRYEKPFALAGRDAGRLRARTFFEGRGSTLIVGAKAQPIGNWKSGELAAQPKEYSYDATGNLSSGGVWRAAFQRSGGDKPLRLDKAAVVVNGTLVAQGKITNNGDRAVARFEVPAFVANAKVTVTATLVAPEGGNVTGEVTLAKSERLEPKVAVASSYPAYQNNTLEMAADWDDDTFFWIADFPKAGVLVTWTFAEPVSASYASVSTGARDGTKDQLVGGALEISEDGTTFRKVGDFTYGSAAATLPNGTKVKAIRVMGTQEQKTWVMLRDPILR